ncbi:MAG: hypothetical protein IPN81_01415 [Nitrosomonadales bacterium]|nr:hypothetical protein [Nitrosomonadales bacterium]
MSSAELVCRRTRFVSRLYRLLDEQSIDVAIAMQGQLDKREIPFGKLECLNVVNAGLARSS